MPKALIVLKSPDGVCRAVRCDADGSPDMVGLMLHNHYFTTEKVENLLRLGNLACLESTPEKSLAYARDLKISKGGAEFRNESSLLRYFETRGIDEYCYIFDCRDEKWRCVERGNAPANMLDYFYAKRVAMPLRRMA